MRDAIASTRGEDILARFDDLALFLVSERDIVQTFVVRASKASLKQFQPILVHHIQICDDPSHLPTGLVGFSAEEVQG